MNTNDRKYFLLGKAVGTIESIAYAVDNIAIGSCLEQQKEEMLELIQIIQDEDVILPKNRKEIEGE